MNNGTYCARQFNLGGLNGISYRTLETHFKLYDLLSESNKRSFIESRVSLHEVGNVSGFHPLLVMDVWEHAYLLDYKPADRPKYIEAFFSNIDWRAVEGRFLLKEALLIGAGLKMQRIERANELAHQ